MAQANDHSDGLMSSLFTVVRSVNKGIERLGVDKASMIVLYSLKEPEQARPSTVAAFCGLDVSTISRHLKRLEDEGLVERRSDPLDRRAQLVALTPTARDLLATLDETRKKSLDFALRDWSDADRTQLSHLLTRLADDLVTSQARTDAGLTSTPA